MALLTTGINMNGVPEALRQMVEDDLPFTIARFLTMQAQTGQTAVREALPIGQGKIFKTRNDWTTRNIKITPATKQTLRSEVFTDTTNRKTGAPDYLPLQDEGGEKVPVAGHRYLAIPTKYLRKIAPGAIPDALRPRHLFPRDGKAQIGEAYNGNFSSNLGGKARRALGREARKKLVSGEYIAFLQRSQSGTLCIFVRHGGIAYTGGAHEAEPWYTLISEAHVKPRFPMEQMVQEAIARSAEGDFSRAAAEVLINNALRSGLRVRF